MSWVHCTQPINKYLLRPKEMAIYCLVYCIIISTIDIDAPHPVLDNRDIQVKVTDTDPVFIKLIKYWGR